MAAGCIFCQIIAGETATEFIYQDEQVVVFKDINPKAPVHVLVMPKEHINSLNELGPEHNQLAGTLLTTIVKVAQQLGIKESGYKTIINTGREGGQLIDHLHIHVLGGKKVSGFAI